MTYRQHHSAVSAPSTLGRIRAEGMRRGLYTGPVAPPLPPPRAALPPTSLTTIPPSPQAAEAHWASDAALRLEFGGSKARYLAFCRGVVAGRAKIAGGPAVTAS